MKIICQIMKCLLAFSALLLLNQVKADSQGPLWTFTPITDTSISVPPDGTATISYVVTNQSTQAYTLTMTPIQGVSQMLGLGNCPLLFTLNFQESCVLSLLVVGSAIGTGVSSGPIVCQMGNPLQCYQPNSDDILDITR